MKGWKLWVKSKSSSSWSIWTKSSKSISITIVPTLKTLKQKSQMTLSIPFPSLTTQVKKLLIISVNQILED